MAVRPGGHRQITAAGQIGAVDALGIALLKQQPGTGIHLQVISALIIDQGLAPIADAFHIVQVVFNLLHLPAVRVEVKDPAFCHNGQISVSILQIHHIGTQHLHRITVPRQIHGTEAADLLNIVSPEEFLNAQHRQRHTANNAKENSQAFEGPFSAPLFTELAQIGDVVRSVSSRSAHKTPCPDRGRGPGQCTRHGCVFSLR